MKTYRNNGHPVEVASNKLFLFFGFSTVPPTLDWSMEEKCGHTGVRRHRFGPGTARVDRAGPGQRSVATNAYLIYIGGLR